MLDQYGWLNKNFAEVASAIYERTNVASALAPE